MSFWGTGADVNGGNASGGCNFDPVERDSEAGALLLNGWSWGPGIPSIGGISEKNAGFGDILSPVDP